MNNPTFGPRCPNHGEFLEGIGFPIPKKGTGICPVSGCPFDFVIEVDENVYERGKTNAFSSLTTNYNKKI